MYSPQDNKFIEIGKEVGVLPRNSNTYFTERYQIINSMLRIQPIQRVPTNYSPVLHPSTDFTDIICTELLNHKIGMMSYYTNINLYFNAYKRIKYPECVEIYTDGSKLEDGSTAAAVYVPSLSVVHCWKLNPMHSVLGSELFAIAKALELVKSNAVLTKESVVIFSDSKSALQTISNTFDPSYRTSIHQIQTLLLHFGKRVKFQWVKSHVGIHGNEIVDKAANVGHQNNVSALSYLNYNCEYLKPLKSSFFQLWTRTWKDKVVLHQKGKFLSDVLAKPMYRPWLSNNSRIVETVSARIRIGHVGVQNHMYRFEMSQDRFCDECGVHDTIEHFIIRCDKYHDNREELKLTMISLGVPFSLKNLLLGGEFDERLQRKIHHSLMKYIRKSGIIYLL